MEKEHHHTAYLVRENRILNAFTLSLYTPGFPNYVSCGRYRYRPSRTGTREVKGTGTGPVLLVANAGGEDDTKISQRIFPLLEALA